VARRVFLHLGLPKTGTSYLQTIFWAHREELAGAGLLVPGRERRDHLWASLVVRDDPRVGRRNALAPESWSVLLDETRAWPGDVLISHEFFGAASSEQASRVLADLAPAEVHLVLTAREPLSLFTSSWQESLKNKGTVPLDDYGRGESDDPLEVWDWRALDLGLVLDRWAADVEPGRVHVVPLPSSGAPPDELWRSFCGVLGVEPGVVGDAGRFPNASMGVVEAETLRRLNQRLAGFDAAFDRGVWIRTFLADERLVPRGGERFWPGADQVEDCRRRGEAAVALVRERGYDVVGDLDSLRVPTDLPVRRHPSSVTDAEVADVALDLVARLMSDLKDGVRPGAGQGSPARRALARRARRRWSRKARAPRGER
jgi:hypothetical protein